MFKTVEEARELAKSLAEIAGQKGVPCAFEVAKIKGGYVAQVAGTHALFKSHKVVEVVPIPEQYRKGGLS